MRKIFNILTLCLICTLSCFAQQTVILSDSASVSLLTCTPGAQTYSKYGHSALRIKDPKQNIDWTFNYGVFNFNTKDFYLKFVRGETWYQLDVEETDWFIYTSSMIGRTTYEQVLNLNKEEKQQLLEALLENYKPKNRYYLYNFVFDNCATRPYHLLKSVVAEIDDVLNRTPLTFCSSTEIPTFRQMVRHYSEANSWPGFGIDFVFGADADKKVTKEERLFLPEQLMQLVGKGQYSDGSRLCLSDNSKPFEIGSKPFIISPYMVLILAAIFIFVVTIIDIRRNRISWWWDCILWFLGTVLGVIVFYLSFFSIHPLVEHNWNLLSINPMLLLPFILVLISASRKKIEQHLLYLALCWLLLTLVRLPLICLQSWHWLMLIPIVHALRLTLLGYMKKRTPITTTNKRLVILVATILYSVSSVIAEPRLTVTICIDGLSSEAMNELRGYWQQGGLRTLDEEAHESSLSFPHVVYGGSETLATILTGTTPDQHAVSSDYYFSRQDRKVHSIFADDEQKGINTDLRMSPTALLAPTLTDEFRMTHSDKSKIYAIGINATNTMLLAGHSANACVWLNQQNLQWATTGYYSEGLPSAADKMNVSGRIEELASQSWIPRMDISMYMHPTPAEKKKPFNYVQKDIIYKSPAANTAVIELALNLQKQTSLGTDSHADLLLLELNVSSPASRSDLLETAEQEDLYIRLNQDLGWLMEQLEKRIGKNNYRIIVFGKPEYGKGTATLKKANLNAGYFNTERAAALCNTYLMAIYGHERWIDGGYGNSIFLNRTLIEQKKIRLSDIQQQVSSFLLEFEGTKTAFPITSVPLIPNGGEEEKLRMSLNKHTAGDVVFTLEPLWMFGEDENKRLDKIAEADPTAPLLLWTTEITSMPERKLSATEVKNLIK